MTAHAVSVLVTISIGIVATIALCRYLAKRHKQKSTALLAVIGILVTVTATAVQRPLELTWDDFFNHTNRAAAPTTGSAPPSAPSEPTRTSASPELTEADNSPSGSDDDDGSIPPATSVDSSAAEIYLADMKALRNGYDKGPYKIAGKSYDRSVGIYCSDSSAYTQVWEVPSGQESFAATVGISDSEPDAFRKSARYTFQDQGGKDLVKSADVPAGDKKEIQFSLQGAVQLRISCLAKDAGSGKATPRIQGVLGDAHFTEG